MKDVRKAAWRRAARGNSPIGGSFETQREKWAVFRQIAAANDVDMWQSSGFTLFVLDTVVQERLRQMSMEMLHSLAERFSRGSSHPLSEGGSSA